MSPSATSKSRSCSVASATPDVHVVRNEWNDAMPTVYPVVPGHEIVGRVTRVGSGVGKHKAGDLGGRGLLGRVRRHVRRV
jgi:D-arabinose 1-dehydrogenase-like Zn-dependent alcohol dehydrogenase